MVEWGRARCLGAATLVVALGTLLVFGAGPVSAGTGLTTVQVPQAVCPPATTQTWSCDAVRLATERVPQGEAQLLVALGQAQPNHAPFGNGPAGGYAPQDLATAYGVNPAASTSQVVGIVDAYQDPSVLADLNTFDAQYGLPAETGNSLEVVNENGGSASSVPTDVGWAGEITLDVEAVRGICQQCKIVLVEANSSSEADLAQGVNEAVALGATVVSNSYGGPEYANDPYTADYNHPGIAILASSGDDGWYGWDVANLGNRPENAPQVPAAFTDVVGVGGTSLTLGAGGSSETVWDGDGFEDHSTISANELLGASGGGCSADYAAPAWQSGVSNYSSLGCGSGMRSSVDVAADADPATGYDTYETTAWCTPGQADGSGKNQCPNSSPGWQTYGGTSLASPLLAGMWALAGGPQGVEYPALTLYGHFQTSPSQFYDVTSGGNGYCASATAAMCALSGNPNTTELFTGVIGPLDCRWDAAGNLLAAFGQCNAGTGFDGPSGIGVPMGTTAFQPLTPTAALSPPSSLMTGAAATFSAANSTAPFPGDSASQFAWSWGDGTTTTASTPTASHVYSSPGTYTVVLTVGDVYSAENGNRTGQASVTVNVKSSCKVPSVIGKTVAAAKRVITTAHCEVGRIRAAYSTKAKKGRVVSQQPRAGKNLPSGSKVNLTVGKAPKKKR